MRSAARSILVGLHDARADHRRFEAAALDSAERVTWRFPSIDPDRKYRGACLREACDALEHDPHGGLAIEIGRLVGLYRDDLLRCLEQHERRHNRGSMPQVQIARDTPRFAVQHVAQHIFACMFHEVTIDATEEDPLLHPTPRH